MISFDKNDDESISLTITITFQASSEPEVIWCHLNGTHRASQQLESKKFIHECYEIPNLGFKCQLINKNFTNEDAGDYVANIYLKNDFKFNKSLIVTIEMPSKV